MKKHLLTLMALAAFAVQGTSQVDIYRSGGGEIIFGGSNVNTVLAGESLDDPLAPTYDVNSNLRFTLFFHMQQYLNVDFTQWGGIYAGAAIRNVGFIVEDVYQQVGFQHIDNTHPNWNKNTKFKRRSYSLGFPIALKLGALNKDYFIYAGGEYEWMFHYKQKLFIEGNKSKYKEWTSDRMNPWIPSVFAGVQFPGGLNLKFKYYLDDFLNTDFRGRDFGEDVDYRQFDTSGVWYISMSLMLNRRQISKMMDSSRFDKSAYNQ